MFRREDDLMKKILVSACLAGFNCRFDGKNNLNDQIKKMVEDGIAIPVCPEQMGGLPTVRAPSGQRGNKVLNNKGWDVTENFKRGAEEALRIAGLYGCKEAILKEGSPSCGYKRTFSIDENYEMKKIDGSGVTTKLLLENGITVRTEKEYE